MTDQYRRSLSAPVQPESIDRGALRPAHELGVAVSDETADDAAHETTTTYRNAARLRASAQKAYLDDLSDETTQPFCSFTYFGMEVVVCATTEHALYVMDARSNMVYQGFALPERVTVLSQFEGHVVAVDAANTVRIYEPVAVDPLRVAFGRYRWQEVSLPSSFPGADHFTESISHAELCDTKLLLAGGTNIGMYDRRTFDLLWTTQLPDAVRLAGISYDGESISIGLCNSEGIYTFRHDLDDGSRLQRQPSVGVVYKPGTFLVHGNHETVTSLAYAGDALLTVTNKTARIFGKECHVLTEWAVPPNTMVSWISGVPALILPDLETKGLRNTNATPHVRRSCGGAWIAEVTGTSLRISRVLFVQRGNDDWKVISQEYMTGVLPLGISSFSCSGVWSVTNTAETTTDTISSAASLGLTQNENSVPMELRIVTAVQNSVIILDSVPYDSESLQTRCKRWSLSHLDSDFAPQQQCPQTATRYDSGQLVAETISSDSIRLVYRTPGSLAFLPAGWSDSDAHHPVEAFERSADQLQDESLLPIPLLLPTLKINTAEKGTAIKSVLWWDDDAFRGAPYLVVILENGSVMVYEIPPVWSFLEPIQTTVFNADASDRASPAPSLDEVESDQYVVSIVPDPEFGLGLRLESHTDGMCAVAGSYKRHPVNKETLPAEKSGLIRLGDELLSADDHMLENKPFDDIIAVVRDLGTSRGPGNPILLRFRRKGRNSDQLGPSSKTRRNVEQIIGLPSDTNTQRKGPPMGSILSAEEASARLLVGKFAKIASSQQKRLDGCCDLVRLNDQDGWDTRKALLFWVDGVSLKVGKCSVDTRTEAEHQSWDIISETTIHVNGAQAAIMGFQVICNSPEEYAVFSCLVSGHVLLNILSTRTGNFTKPSQLIDLNSPWTRECHLRVYSTMLFATFHPDRGSNESVMVWSGSPRPNVNAEGKSDDNTGADFYTGTEVVIPEQSSGSDVLDFDFIRPGFIDNDPVLVLSTTSSISLYSKACWESRWKQRLSVKLLRNPLLSSSTSKRICRNKPQLVFPHLRTGCFSAFNSIDETNGFCSTWHPDSLLAQIFTNPSGVRNALPTTKGFFDWLISEGDEVPIGERYSHLTVGPVDADAQVHQRTSNVGSSIVDFKTSLLTHINSTLARTKQKMVKRPPTAIDEKENFNSNLPAILLELDPLELRVVWAVAESVSSSLDLEGIDQPAQIAVYSEFLFSKLLPYTVKGTSNTAKQTTMPSHSMMARSVSMSRGITKERIPTISSSGALAALISDDQSKVLDRMCDGQTITWSFVRSRRMILWTRSDTKIAEICAKVGQSTFLKSRDIMECALFFIIANKIPTMRNFAATDQSTTGKTFSQFLGKFDFSSERGRQAAEKNAFSLLRKCKYQAAAAFFLLAEPPFLKSAVETIATKTNDMDLAFLIARLMESPSRSEWSGGRSTLGSLGGGYASGPAAPTLQTGQCDGSFADWSPVLGKQTRELLIDRMLPEFSKDDKLGALTLLWLKCKAEAGWLLSGHLDSETVRDIQYRVCKDCPSRTCKQLHDLRRSQESESEYITLRRANSIIDASSSPRLLVLLGLGGEMMYASSHNTAQVLKARGIEMSSFDALAASEKHSTTATVASSKTAQPKVSKVSTKSSEPMSSIFDDFAMPPAPPPNPSSIFDNFDPPPHSTPTTSIFDDFDVPPQVSKPPQTNHPSQSSIFDTYDTQKPTKILPEKPASSSLTSNPQNGEMSNEDVMYVPFKVQEWHSIELWTVWRGVTKVDVMARRFLREIASLIARFYGDPREVPMTSYLKDPNEILFPCVAEVLQTQCDSKTLISKLKSRIAFFVSLSGQTSAAITKRSLALLGFTRSRRILFSVLLHVVRERQDLAEEVVRAAANGLIKWANTFVNGYDDLSSSGRTRYQSISHYLRKEAARISWQLEVCLWLHRGDGLQLSGPTLKETLCAVRIGLFLASWNTDASCINHILSCDADFPSDEEFGRHLWTSVNFADLNTNVATNQRASSGGWEFLVNCKRSQATELLRDRPTGSFIVRPHPDDDGVFTLSFKTNLFTKKKDENQNEEASAEHATSDDEAIVTDSKKKAKKDDVVQHAIVRLSDSGFRCGSFGPFASLNSLLEAVSESLPFKLRFDLPPKNLVIPEDRHQVSPNAVLLRQLTLRNASELIGRHSSAAAPRLKRHEAQHGHTETDALRSDCFAAVYQVMMLSLFRKQLCACAAANVDQSSSKAEIADDGSGDKSTLSSVDDLEADRIRYIESSRFLRPILDWCRVMELTHVGLLFPSRVETKKLLPEFDPETGEMDTNSTSNSILKGMVQPDSGVDFATLRLIDGGDCTMLILFRQREAISWIINNDIEVTTESAERLLQRIEDERVIEQIEIEGLPLKKTSDPESEKAIRYRIIDPWEVEIVKSREGETQNAAIGRHVYATFSLGQVALSTEQVFRQIGGVPLLEAWANLKGGVALTKAISSVLPPLQRADAGHELMDRTRLTEKSQFVMSIRQALYRNVLFRRLDLPQRFLALVQVEMLDLKNLTTPGGTVSLTAYALLRLKRAGQGTLTNKARTIDTAATPPLKLAKSTVAGPNAPASWGSVVRFRFPLPEEACLDGSSQDPDQDVLFKGPPSVLQIAVYEKRLLVDHALGVADVRMDDLGPSGLEEWVPLKTESRTISWFARIRLTLRFELMCLEEDRKNVTGVGAQRIQDLARSGGSAQEDPQKRSVSSPDLMSYFESIAF